MVQLIQDVPNQSLDKKKFLIQILIAIAISIFFQLVIDPLIYEPYIRHNLGVFDSGPAIAICSLSQWFFSFAIAFFYYRHNEILNSYLFSAFLPLFLIVVVEFYYLFFIDFLHSLPLIIIFYILFKYRSTIKLKNVIVANLVLVVWASIVRLIGTNYTTIPLFPIGVLLVTFYPPLTILLFYLIKWIEKKVVKAKN